MDIYVDTNIFMSAFDCNDPFHQMTTKLMDYPRVNFVTGFISVLEFEMVVGRLWVNKLIHFAPDVESKILQLSEPDQVQMITEYCFGKLNVKILSLDAQETFHFNREDYHLGNDFTIAYKIGSIIHLKTLDILHLAAALKIKSYTPYNIEYFLTNDLNIINHSRQISLNLSIIPITSERLGELLQLNPTSDKKTF